MSEESKKYRDAGKARVQRIVGGESGPVDASGWKPESSVEPLNTEIKTGLRPLSKRAFKRGGAVEGEEASHHAGRAKRKEGGVTKKPHYLEPLQPAPVKRMPPAQGAETSGAGRRDEIEDNSLRPTKRKEGGVTVNKIINRDLKDANQDREGHKHVGALKDGGKAEAHPARDRDLKAAELLVKDHKRKDGGSVSDGETEGTRPKGGREAHARGGKAGKGKMNVNIIIGSPHGQPQPAAAPPLAPPPARPVPAGPPLGTPMGPSLGAPAGPSLGTPMGPPLGTPMGHKAGGAVKMRFGAGGGEGRKEKIQKYGEPQRK